jgi:hypothetical protein
MNRIVIYYKDTDPPTDTNRPPQEIVDQWHSVGCLIDQASDIPKKYLTVEMPHREQCHFDTHEEVTVFIGKKLLQGDFLNKVFQFVASTGVLGDEAEMINLGWVKLDRVQEAFYDMQATGMFGDKEHSTEVLGSFKENAEEFRRGLVEFVCYQMLEEKDSE